MVRWNECVCRILEKYYVGELVDNEMPVFPKRGWEFFITWIIVKLLEFLLSEFYVTVKQKVDDYFKKNNIVSSDIADTGSDIFTGS